MTGPDSDSRPRRDRDWLWTLVGVLLLIALSGVMVGWTFPLLLFGGAEPLAGVLVAGWMVFLAVICMSLCRSAADGDRIAERALERREDRDWVWPDCERREP